MRTLRLFSFIMICIAPVSVFAASGTLTTEDTLKQLILIVSQYDARIKLLESENALLKNEMVKAGIKIPLTEFSGAVIQTGTTTTIPSTYLTGILTPVVQTGSVAINTGAVLSQLSAQYGADVGGFVARIQKEWKEIKNAYKLPANANIGGYEFVQKDANDHVFVDIIYGTGTTGIYDAKILYQFEKKEYKRKLIGFFEYNTTTGKYITKSGNNPFPGVARSFIKDPYFTGVITPPSTATTATPAQATPAPVTLTNNTGTTVTLGSVTLVDIEKAYNEKRYLSVISLSNTYLSGNPATYDLLRIRYRTYFIIGKYSESLAEIGKIDALGKLDKQTACDAQVIATYGKDTTLVAKYAAVCK